MSNKLKSSISLSSVWRSSRNSWVRLCLVIMPWIWNEKWENTVNEYKIETKQCLHNIYVWFNLNECLHLIKPFFPHWIIQLIILTIWYITVINLISTLSSASNFNRTCEFVLFYYFCEVGRHHWPFLRPIKSLYTCNVYLYSFPVNPDNATRVICQIFGISSNVLKL